MTRRESAKRPAYEPAAGLLRPERHHPGTRRPATVTAGALLTLLRALSGGFVLAQIMMNWRFLVGDTAELTDALADPEVDQLVRGMVLGVGSVGLLVMCILIVFIYRGHNWARLVTMSLSAVSVSALFVAWWVQGQEIRVSSTLPSLSLDILVLLALSSPSAAAYARRFHGQSRSGDRTSS